MITPLLDVHTHTLVSGHAFCTLNEMIAEAQRRGLQLFGVTEHAPAIPGTCDPLYFRNMYIVPRQYGNMRLLMGAELNIIDYEGNLDLTEDFYLKGMEVRIAGLHLLCYNDGTKQQNTSALIGAIENPAVHIISHPCDGTASQLDLEAVVQASKRTDTLLELNNSSLNPLRKKHLARSMYLEMLNICKRENVRIILGSDAHHTSTIADYHWAEELLQETDFPDELIINDKIEQFLEVIHN